MVFSINKSCNENNVNSSKLFFNGLIPDWSNGAVIDPEGTVVNLPADDCFGFNFIKISTYCNVHTNYTIKIFACPPQVPSKDLFIEKTI